MQLVIELDEKLYTTTKSLPDFMCGTLQTAIKNGVPLTKGHGRLVDMSEVIVKLMQYYDGDKTIGQCLDEVHTVIDAARK